MNNFTGDDTDNFEEINQPATKLENVSINLEEAMEDIEETGYNNTSEINSVDPYNAALENANLRFQKFSPHNSILPEDRAQLYETEEDYFIVVERREEGALIEVGQGLELYFDELRTVEDVELDYELNILEPEYSEVVDSASDATRAFKDLAKDYNGVILPEKR